MADIHTLHALTVIDIRTILIYLKMILNSQ